MKLKNGDTILFIGDSITDCGRARPVGERNGLGDGYVACVDSLLAAYYPERHVRILNTGVSGNRVIDFNERWQTDVLDLQPQWLSVMIGINDVWRHFKNPADPSPVTIGKFEAVYRELLIRTRPGLQGLVLMTPYVLETDKKDPMRKMMDAYGGIVRQLADEFAAVYVDVQDAFDRYLEHRPAESLSTDRVHPNLTGHMIIATACLTALDNRQSGPHAAVRP